MPNPFHIAVPVDDIETSRAFYRDALMCEEGRSDKDWVDFNLFGHQFVIHQVDNYVHQKPVNPVDGKSVPVPHFGVVLNLDEFWHLAENLKDHNIEFIIEPYIRFRGQTGEQATMFFEDPSGNSLEFKAFKDMSQLFAK